MVQKISKEEFNCLVKEKKELESQYNKLISQAQEITLETCESCKGHFRGHLRYRLCPECTDKNNRVVSIKLLPPKKNNFVNGYPSFTFETEKENETISSTSDIVNIKTEDRKTTIGIHIKDGKLTIWSKDCIMIQQDTDKDNYDFILLNK